jgi:protein-tyrosine phosphatase
VNVLFLCTGNYYRSRFAEEYFNAVCAGRSLSHRAASRGLAEEFERLKNPGPVSADTLAELKTLGITVKKPIRKPQKLSGTEVPFFDLIVCLDKKEHLPLVKKRTSLRGRKVIYWKIKDLGERAASLALPECRKKIDELILAIEEYRESRKKK